MNHVCRRRGAIGTGVVVLGLALASGAAGQGGPDGAVHDARRLGGTSAFYTPPLRTVASLKQMVARKGISEDIRTVLRESGIPETADAVLATLSGATSSVKSGFCDEATPADGVIVECDVRPGSILLWMALRPNAGTGNRAPGRLERVRWAGDAPFKALLFRVTNDYRTYTFILPMACGNLSLMSVKVVEGEPVDVSVDRVCDPTTANLRATFKASCKDLERVQQVRLTLNGEPAGELTGPSWATSATRPGDYTVDAIDTKGRPYPVARRAIRVDACPALPPPAARQVVAPTCGVALSVVPKKGAYEITVDATRSATGTNRVAPVVMVELRDPAGAAMGEKLVLDSSLTRTITVRRRGVYHATATVSTPEAIEEGAYRYEGTSACETSVTIERPASSAAVFFDVLGGKERRVRPIEDTNLEFAQCSPLLGLKLGVAKQLRNQWELAGTIGGAISLVSDDQKVKESALLVDAEVNKYLDGGAFIGTGLSLWDLTRSDTWTPAWLLHVGLPLSKSERHPVYFMAEGRAFFDHIDDVRSNYQVWGGLRVHFRR